MTTSSAEKTWAMWTDLEKEFPVPVSGEEALLGPAGAQSARQSSRRASRGREALARRLGTPLENAQRLFRRGEAMGEFLLQAGLVEDDLLVIAREDAPLPDHTGLRSLIIAWVPGGGFAYMTGEGGEFKVVEVYRTPEEMASGVLPLRLLAAASRNLVAEDAGERLVRMLENTRKLHEWGL